MPQPIFSCVADLEPLLDRPLLGPSDRSDPERGLRRRDRPALLLLPGLELHRGRNLLGSSEAPVPHVIGDRQIVVLFRHSGTPGQYT